MRELTIPPAAMSDQDSIEIARIWAANNAQHVTLAAGLWEDPFGWGIMLVDLARHVARSYGQLNQMSAEEALQRIREGFDAEWDSPTDEPAGGIVE